MLLVISGPSGVGKGTLISALLTHDPEWRMSRSMTTREPRAGETHEYLFVNRQEFLTHVANGRMAEWAEYSGNLYGTPRSELCSEKSLVECDVQGYRQLRQNISLITSVFLLPPSQAVLEERLRGRGTEDEDHVQQRLLRASAEIASSGEYDATLTMNNPQQGLADLIAIIADNVEV